MWQVLTVMLLVSTSQSEEIGHRNRFQWVPNNPFPDFIRVRDLPAIQQEPVTTLSGEILRVNCSEYQLKWESEANEKDYYVDTEPCAVYLHLLIGNKPELLHYRYFFIATSRDVKRVYKVSVEAKWMSDVTVPTLERPTVSQDLTTGSQTAIPSEVINTSVTSSSNSTTATNTTNTGPGIADSDTTDPSFESGTGVLITNPTESQRVNEAAAAATTAIGILLALVTVIFVCCWKYRQRRILKRSQELEEMRRELQKFHLDTTLQIDDLSKQLKKTKSEDDRVKSENEITASV